MANSDYSEYTGKNLIDGIATLRDRQQRGMVMAPDVSNVQFQVNTNEALRFLAGYVSVLIERVDELEAQIEGSAA